MSSYEVTVEADSNGELILPLPVELLSQMGWDDGDTLLWEECGPNSFTLTKDENK
jgi:hypothetical protein